MKTAEEEAEDWKVLRPEARKHLAKVLTERDADLRRLVEEAQGETKRVNGELETELRQHAASYDAMRIERDRLKGELAEARRLLAIANYVGMSPATAKQNGFVSDDHRPIAAPPAEPTQSCACGRPWHRDAIETSGGKLGCTGSPAEQAQPTYDDGEGKPAPLNAERLISAKPIKTAKAQGEGAPKCQRVTCDGGIECRCAAVRERQLVEDESRLEDSLINRIAEAKSYTLAQVAVLAKRVDVIEEWARRQIAEPWFDPERKPAPPDAAGYRITPALGGIHPAPVDPVAALAKRMEALEKQRYDFRDRLANLELGSDALEDRVSMLDGKNLPPRQQPELVPDAKIFGGRPHPFIPNPLNVHVCAGDIGGVMPCGLSDGHPIHPAPPSPGVAGPGHAFINDGKRRCDVHRDGEKCGLPPWEAIHAIPPIPEGK